MGKSLVKNYMHLITSTKHRYPFIEKEIENELFNYIGGVCKELECDPIIVGGYRDHIHILCHLSKKLPLMKLMEEVKSHSSKWIKTKGEDYLDFYWQHGYGGFSVSKSHVERVRKYIERQEEHHTNQDFKTEFRTFLDKYDLDYDERYVWD